MVKILGININLGNNDLKGKQRKYPIKRDGSGLSMRQRAFALFDSGRDPPAY